LAAPLNSTRVTFLAILRSLSTVGLDLFVTVAIVLALIRGVSSITFITLIMSLFTPSFIPSITPSSIHMSNSDS
jgi:hypothetical protein